MTNTYTQTHTYKRHDEDDWSDEVRIVTVPRWKTSGLSGDEWRFSFRVELWRKGRVWAQKSCGNMKYAAVIAAAALHLVDHELKNMGWEVLHEPRGDFALCFNPGCPEPATVEYRMKKEYDHGHETSSYRADNRPHRRFCDAHKRRGDCAFDDADTNYEPVELTDIAPTVDDMLRGIADNLHTPTGTNERLKYALQQVGLDALAERAAAGEFSDFDSPHAMPKMVLHSELLALGTPEATAIDERMKNGEFDG